MDQSTLQDAKPLRNMHMMMLAIVVGIMSGIGAILFRNLVDSIIKVCFYGNSHAFYSATQHIPLFDYKFLIILVPVIGAFIVTFLTTHFAHEAKGHGVPETIYAIHYKKGIISPLVALIKVLASAVTIGTGGSAGREGPIIQIGASLGSTLGQLVSMPSQQKIVLIAAGAGAGLAATFGAPITGLAFAIELMLLSVNMINLSMVAIAVVSATFISYSYFGDIPEFTSPITMSHVGYQQYLLILVFLIPFSLLVGAVSFAFIRLMYMMEIFFLNTFDNPYVRHMLGMTFVGIILYLLQTYFGHYYVGGIGYSTVNDIFQFLLQNPWLLLLLCLCKLLATCLTLGSGGSGGIFSPALFIGATLGGAYGIILNYLLPGYGLNPLIFVTAGMAGIVGSATGLIVTAILLIFEVTRDYTSILPIMITVAISCVVRMKLGNETIFTMMLYKRGFFVSEGLERK